MKPLVIYHDSCTDGFAAAFAAWLKLGDDAEYLPIQYGQTSPDMMADKCSNRDVYILDFSFDRLVMEHIFKAAERVVWLDHHKTAFEMWCGKYEKQMFYMAAEEGDPRIKIHLNDNKSGALLAWEYFHPNTKAPMFIRHIDDRDRWQFKLEGSKWLHAALNSMKPWSFEQWKELLMVEDRYGDGPFFTDTKCQVLRVSGGAILRAQDAVVESLSRKSKECSIYDKSDDFVDKGLAVNFPIYQSEIGHELANASGTFGLVWFVNEDNVVICSLRSNGDYDVSNIAKLFGGGGHKNAAGFKTNIDTLMRWLGGTE